MRIDDRLDAIQELRDALNLVDEDGSRCRRRRQELPLEAFGLRNEFAKCRQARKVQRDVWLERAEERRLPDLARATPLVAGVRDSARWLDSLRVHA